MSLLEKQDNGKIMDNVKKVGLSDTMQAKTEQKSFEETQ